MLLGQVQLYICFFPSNVNCIDKDNNKIAMLRRIIKISNLKQYRLIFLNKTIQKAKSHNNFINNQYFLIYQRQISVLLDLIDFLSTQFESVVQIETSNQFLFLSHKVNKIISGHYMTSAKKSSLQKNIVLSYPNWQKDVVNQSLTKQSHHLLSVKPYKPYFSTSKGQKKPTIETQRKHISDQVVVLHLQNLQRHALNVKSIKKRKKLELRSLIDTKPLTSWSKNRQHKWHKQQNNYVTLNSGRFEGLIKKNTNSQEQKEFIRARKKIFLELDQTREISPKLNQAPVFDFSSNNFLQPCTIRTLHLEKRYNHENQKFKRKLLNTSLTNRVPVSVNHHRYLSQFRKNMQFNRGSQQPENNSKQCLQPWKIYQSSSKIV